MILEVRPFGRFLQVQAFLDTVLTFLAILLNLLSGEIRTKF